MNCGHDGSLSTGHANSCRDMLSRLETMTMMAGMELPLLAIRQQIASGIDILIHLARMPDKSRKVTDIVEMDGIEQGEIVLHPLFQYRDGTLSEVGRIKHTYKLKIAGIHI